MHTPPNPPPACMSLQVPPVQGCESNATMAPRERTLIYITTLPSDFTLFFLHRRVLAGQAPLFFPSQLFILLLLFHRWFGFVIDFTDKHL